MNPKIAIIVAHEKNHIIGRNNKLIWHLPNDLKRFKKLTYGHHIIMGRRTWESIGRPLPNRTSVIITRQQDYSIPDCCIVASSIEDALGKCANAEKVFIIGGGEIYAQAISLADELFITQVNATVAGDCSFPIYDKNKWELVNCEEFPTDEKHKYSFKFVDYKNKII